MFVAQSTAEQPSRAVEQLTDAFADEDLGTLLFFASSRFDLPSLQRGLADRFDSIPVIGCTTAGEIGPAGYRSGTLVGVGLPASDFRIASVALRELQAFDEGKARALASDMFRSLAEAPGNYFSVLLIDGLSGSEERVALTCQRALADVPLVGGSAGDDQFFRATHVYHADRFLPESAVWALIKTPLPFKVFRSSHFFGHREPLVVTEADAGRRIVHEINGVAAVTAYAHAIGVAEDALTSEQFAAAPLVVRIAGNDYVRSIQHANPDGSLKLYCAIERGVVLHIGHAIDLAASRRALFDEIHASVGEPLVILGFDCIHCRLESERMHALKAVERLFIDNHVAGFSSYGEQFVGMHVNQTFTGVAIGAMRRT